MESAVSHVGRRQFLIAGGALLAAPRTARAQQPGRNYVVGALLVGGLKDRERYGSTLRERLASHGFVEGRNLRIEFGVTEGAGAGSGRKAAGELLAMKLDAIFTCTVPFTQGAAAATRSVPIVFALVSDPVRAGIIDNLARPGGNITGASSRLDELMLKRLELALELVPGTKRIAVISKIFGTYYVTLIRPLLVEAAGRLNIKLIEADEADFQVIEVVRKAGAQVVFLPLGLLGSGQRGALERIVRDSLAQRLPLVVADAYDVEAGGLISFSTNSLEELRRGADMLARVLKGEKPGDLPVDQASRFELALNLKTAKALGLTIPSSIMLRADRVIE